MTVTTLAYTGAVQLYTVPAGVTWVQIECWGAAGGGSGGLGGYAKGGLIVSPGTVLNVNVGGVGAVNAGGFNGGGSGASWSSLVGGGGGASDVRLGGTDLSNRVIVAGGGGGNGGVGGGGAADVSGLATQTSGNQLGYGGNGGSRVYSNGSWTYYGFPGAGGGGGGYWGGPAGPGPASGGSGYTGTLIAPTMTNALRSGNGQVVITSLNTAPTAPTPTTPPINSYIFPTDPNIFAWTYNDPDPGDYQTRADFRYKRAGDAVWTTLTSVATTLPTFTLAANTWTTGAQYEWQVSTYDNASVQSPWSASSFVNAIAVLTAPTITGPSAGTAEYTTPVTLSWTLPAGFTSDAYQVQRNAAADGTGTMYYDSGIVASTGLTASIPLDATAGRTDFLRVAYRYFGHWSPFASSSIVNQFGPPQVPMVVCVTDPPKAAVSVSITNPAAGGGYTPTMVNDLYRTGIDGVRIRIAANLGPNATYVDKLAGAGTNTYTVIAFAANGASATSV